MLIREECDAFEIHRAELRLGVEAVPDILGEPVEGVPEETPAIRAES